MPAVGLSRKSPEARTVVGIARVRQQMWREPNLLLRVIEIDRVRKIAPCAPAYVSPDSRFLATAYSG